MYRHLAAKLKAKEEAQLNFPIQKQHTSEIGSSSPPQTKYIFLLKIFSFSIFFSFADQIFPFSKYFPHFPFPNIFIFYQNLILCHCAWNRLVPIGIATFRYVLVCHPVFCQACHPSSHFLPTIIPFFVTHHPILPPIIQFLPI